MNLREVSTEALARELQLRRSCVKCGTKHSSGWHPAGRNRALCDMCQAIRVVEKAGSREKKR